MGHGEDEKEGVGEEEEGERRRERGGREEGERCAEEREGRWGEKGKEWRKIVESGGVLHITAATKTPQYRKLQYSPQKWEGTHIQEDRYRRVTGSLTTL